MGIRAAINQFNITTGITKLHLPTPHEARWLTEQSRYSPDLGYLEMREWHLLFAMEDFKTNHTHHCLIEDSSFIATAYSTHHFNYWGMEAGDERMAIPLETNKIGTQTVRYFPPGLKVKGELHLIRSHQFLGLDTYKRNTVQFRRKRMNVIVPYREMEWKYNRELCDAPEIPPALQGTRHAILSAEKVYIIRAWVYVAMPQYWDNLLDAGWRGFKTVNYYESKRPWLREYYDYPKRPLK